MKTILKFVMIASLPSLIDIGIQSTSIIRFTAFPLNSLLSKNVFKGHQVVIHRFFTLSTYKE